MILLATLASCAAQDGPGRKSAANAGSPQPVAAPALPGATPPSAPSIGPFENGLYSLSADPRHVAISIGGSPTVRVLNVEDGGPSVDLVAPQPNVLGLRFSPDGRQLAGISPDQSAAYVWNIDDPSAPRTVRLPITLWGAIPLSDGAQIVAGGTNGWLGVVSTETGAIVRNLTTPETFRNWRAAETTIYGLALSHSGRWLSAIVGGRAVVVIDLQDQIPMRFAAIDAKLRLRTTEFSPDERFLVAAASSFAPPKTIQVGPHPDVKDDTRNEECHTATTYFLVGLLGSAICDAVVNSSARQGAPTTEVAGLAAGLMLWNLDEPTPIVVRTFGRTFDQVAWSEDSSKLLVIGNSMLRSDLVKLVQVFQRSKINARASVLPPPVESLTLGVSKFLRFGVIASGVGTLFIERQLPFANVPTPTAASPTTHARSSTLEHWRIPSLRPNEDEDEDGAS